MLDFKKLKEASDLGKLQKAVEEQNTKKNYGDNPDEFWRPKVDKAGNGSAKIRFLPSPPQDGEEGLPWVKWWRYSFQGPGGWYIQNSLATLDQADPAALYNNRLYASKLEANIAQAKKQNRTQTICCNVEILQDPLQPEFEGLVRKYKFGVKIFNKIEAAMQGDDDNPAYNPFDFFEGADFRLKIKTIKIPGQRDQPNYDDSTFLARAPRSNDEEFLERLWDKEFSLKALLAPNQFKSYDELEKELTRVLGFNPNHDAQNAPTVRIIEKEITKPTVESKLLKEDKIDVPWEDNTSNDKDLDYFKSLAEDN